MEVKECSQCHIVKPFSEFHKGKCFKGIIRSACKECSIKAGKIYRLEKVKDNPHMYRDRTREYRKNKPDALKNYVLQREYNITLEKYNQIFEDQKGCCAICGRHQIEFKRPLGVDHNHDTGKVRGLLCNACNSAIGFFNDRLELFDIAKKYLENGIL